MGRITLEEQNCRGCLACQLVCSVTKTGRADLNSARLLLVEGPSTRRISLSPDCDGCGLCARVCEFGAIAVEEVRDKDGGQDHG